MSAPRCIDPSRSLRHSLCRNWTSVCLNILREWKITIPGDTHSAFWTVWQKHWRSCAKAHSSHSSVSPKLSSPKPCLGNPSSASLSHLRRALVIQPQLPPCGFQPNHCPKRSLPGAGVQGKEGWLWSHCDWILQVDLEHSNIAGIREALSSNVCVSLRVYMCFMVYVMLHVCSVCTCECACTCLCMCVEVQSALHLSFFRQGASWKLTDNDVRLSGQWPSSIWVSSQP